MRPLQWVSDGHCSAVAGLNTDFQNFVLEFGARLVSLSALGQSNRPIEMSITAFRSLNATFEGDSSCLSHALLLHSLRTAASHSVLRRTTNERNYCICILCNEAQRIVL